LPIGEKVLKKWYNVSRLSCNSSRDDNTFHCSLESIIENGNVTHHNPRPDYIHFERIPEGFAYVEDGIPNVIFSLKFEKANGKCKMISFYEDDILENETPEESLTLSCETPKTVGEWLG